MVTYKYRMQRAAHTKQVGAKADISVSPDKKERLSQLQQQLDVAMARLAEKERENDAKGIEKMNEIIWNLKQTIQGM